MTLAGEVHVGEVVRQRFVGRSAALNAFYLRFAYRHMKNGVYYYGEGGLGKTWILKRILLDGQDNPTRVVTDIIDFFDTKNHTVRGLQTTIKSRLPNPEAFRPYDEAVEHLEDARSEEDKHPGAIASLEFRADRLFIECCQQAIIGQEVVLLFDTFERAQELRVGQWLIEEFLPNVRSLVVAIAGRPDPASAQVSDNIVPYELEGLSLVETREYIHQSRPTTSEAAVQSIWKHTNGAPLFIDLILDLGSKFEQFVTGLNRLKDEAQVKDSPELERRLVARFTRPTGINSVIWVMAYFKRRFDVQMLKHIVEDEEIKAILPLPLDYNQTLEQFKRPTYARYIKEYPEKQSHLLHDEVQRLVVEYVLPEVAQWGEIEKPLRDLIVSHYYPGAIADPEAFGYPKSSLPDIYQLQAEQLGYILDSNPGAGLEQYEAYRRGTEHTHNYDFEELLWGEMRDHLDDFEDSYRICQDRGEWLRKHSLFQKAERHYRQMVTCFGEQPIEIRQSLGFMLLRQGKIVESEQVFQENRSLVRDDDFRNIAMVENTLGQVAQRAGKWEQSLRHYTQSFNAAVRVRDPHMASAYLNRGGLYALQGAYEQAREQCERAIELLDSLPKTKWNVRRNIYAHRNLGSAYRYSSDYTQALRYYETSLELANRSNDLEAVCNVLQHIGINEHLWGRTFRRDLLSRLRSQRQGVFQETLNSSCEHQLKAWQNLTKSLEMAREADWRDMIDDGLHRLGKVYREVHRILSLLPQLGQGINVPGTLKELQHKGADYQVPLEGEYEHQLLTRGRFEQLNWMERAIRLFDLGALVADDVNDIHRALDSLTELARTFVELDLKDQVRIILRRIERLKGYDYQETLFDAMNEITRGDLDFIEHRLDSALERYAKAYADVAEQSGYAWFLLTDRLRDLEWHLRVLPPETALRWCDILQNEWQDRLLPEKWPDMLGALERIRTEIWIRETPADNGESETKEGDL